ncbi:MAG: pyruvate, water dikinase regulatory protein [Gammaproteobacteria bacterium]
MIETLKKRTVFFVSDRTGKTSESIAQSLLSQFDGFEYEYKYFSFVNTLTKAKFVADCIKLNKSIHDQGPLVFSTLVSEESQKLIAETEACVISLFDTFIKPLEKALKVNSSNSMGKTHEEYDNDDYKKHIDAIEFTIKNDDGVNTKHFSEADVILVGVSRCAKTPTSLFLAMNFSIKTANYPLTSDDLWADQLPDSLLPHTDKIVGLTIKPDQLSAIREQRRPKSDYASLKTCKEEVKRAENIMNNSNLFIIDSTATSIEEIAVNIIKEKKLLIDH